MTSQIQADLNGIASDVQIGKKSNATKGNRGGGARARQRMMTPEATPEPDESRINADKIRTQEAASKDGGAEFSTTRVEFPSAEEDNASVLGEETNDNASVAGEETNYIQEILKCGKDEYRKILGADDSYADDKVQEEAFLDGLFQRGEQAHPKVNTSKDAEVAFQRIIAAAVALKIDDDSINAVLNWDGKGADGDGDGDDMEGVTENEVPFPHPMIVGIYQQATPYIAQLLKDPKSEAAAKALDDLNDQIKKKNVHDGIALSDQWKIGYQDLAVIYEKARPAMDRVQKDPNDERAKLEVEAYSKDLQDIITPNRYPPWNLDLDIEALAKSLEASATSQALAKAQASTAPIDLTPTPPELAPGPTPANDESQRMASDGPQASAKEVPACSQAAQKIQLETLALWANMGWSTYKMSDGDIILSHKALSRKGKEYAFEFTVMTQDSPYFQVKLGSEIGGKEMDAYLALPKIYKINTDVGNKDTPTYTYRDQANYDKLLWVAAKPRKQTLAERKPRAPDTQACVVWKDGRVSEMARGHFKKVTTENEVRAIEKYCRSVDIKAPWEMDPKSLTVSANSTLGQQLLQAGRTGSAIDLNTPAAKVATSNAENPAVVSSSLQTSFAALQKSLEAMDSKFEKSQMSMQEQINRQLTLQTQMQQQLSKQQEDQTKLQQQLLQQMVSQGEAQAKLLALLSKLSPASS